MARIVLADAETDQIEDLLASDLGDETIAEMRASLDADGQCVVAGFLNSEAVARALAETEALLPWIYWQNDASDVEALKAAVGVDIAGGVRDTHYGHLVKDQIGPHTVVSRVFQSPRTKRFVAACLGIERVYEAADPIVGMILTWMPPGASVNWHYDTTVYAVTLGVRAADRGGELEYVSGLRQPGDENPDGLRDVLEGRHPSRTLSYGAGDLVIFKGRYTVHRVLPVQGSTCRVSAIFSYSDRPGVVGLPDKVRRLYGRVLETHLIAGQVQDDGLFV